MLIERTGGSSELASVVLSIPNAPSVSLTNGTSIYRKLTISNFEVIVNFSTNNNLTNLNAGQDYTLSARVLHQLSQQYKSIDDIEGDFGDIAVPDQPATY